MSSLFFIFLRNTISNHCIHTLFFYITAILKTAKGQALLISSLLFRINIYLYYSEYIFILLKVEAHPTLLQSQYFKPWIYKLRVIKFHKVTEYSSLFFFYSSFALVTKNLRGLRIVIIVLRVEFAKSPKLMCACVSIYQIL